MPQPTIYDSVKCINAVRLTDNYLKGFDFQAGMGV